jgi:hypothetical protein
MATVALESIDRKQSEERRRTQREKGGECGGDGAPVGAHEALPHTPPGGAPPETPAPFPSGIHVPERKESVKGSQAAHKPRALDRFLPFRRLD